MILKNLDLNRKHIAISMNKPQKLPSIYVCIALLFTASCGNLQSVFSEQAYQQAVSLKVESLQLIDQATDSYLTHEAEIDLLKKGLEKAYEYARGRPKNATSARQWELMIDPERNLLGGFLARWEEQGSFSETFIANNKGIISDAFDTIIQLESGKMKPSDVE